MSEFTKMASGGMSKKPDTLIQLRKGKKSDQEITADQIIKAYEHKEGLPRRIKSLASSDRRKKVRPSNRAEEHLAKALYILGELTLQDGTTKLQLLDYQVPLKRVRSDEGVGKIDLVGVVDQTLAIVELKTKDSEDHPVDVLLEVLSYGAIVVIKENFENFKKEYELELQTEVKHIILAPREYWDRCRKRTKGWDQFRKLCEALQDGPCAIQCLAFDQVAHPVVD